MATTLDQTIAQKQHSWLSSITASQTFWVLVAVLLACIFLSLATESFDTQKNLYNITRNATFVAIIALGMTLVIITGGIDLSVGSVLCLCSMVLAVTMNAGYSIEIGILASLGTALVIGLGVSLFQAVTSIHEQTLSFVPKVLGIVVILVITLPWMARSAVEFTTMMIERMPQMVR